MARKRILLIDDYVPFATSLKVALAELHDVEIASTGAQAIERLTATPYDVLVCDLMMPQMSGPELHRLVSERWPGLERKIIFITGGSFTQESCQFLAKVENQRLEKPFSVEALNALVQGTGDLREGP